MLKMRAFTDSTMHDVHIQFTSEPYAMLHYPVWEAVLSPDMWKAHVIKNKLLLTDTVTRLQLLLQFYSTHVANLAGKVDLFFNEEADDDADCLRFDFGFTCKKEMHAPAMRNIVTTAKQLQYLLLTGDSNIDFKIVQFSS